MFKHNSVHGGGWRCGYKVDSIQKAAVVVNNFGGPDHFWLLARLTVSTVITSGYATALYAVGLL